MTADKGVSPDAGFKTRRFLLALTKETRAVLFANVNNCHETNSWRDPRQRKLRWGDFSANYCNLKPLQERFKDFFKSAVNRKQMTTAVTDFDIKNYRGGSCVLALDSPRKIKPSTAYKM